MPYKDTTSQFERLFLNKNSEACNILELMLQIE